MGYTHYWVQQRNFKVAEWKTASDDIGKILNHAKHEMGVALANGMGEGGTSPIFDMKNIIFNGLGDDSHETFAIERVIRKPDYAGHRKGWDFCKTARKPYDIVVTAVLCYLSTATRRFEGGEPVLGSEIYSVSSDGKGADFLAGLELARTALPHLANVLDIPMGVMQSDRWCAPWVNINRESCDYEVHFCVDGCGYVINSKGESHCFPTHADLARWLDLNKRVAFSKGGKTGWGEYGKVEENIWNAYGSFDKARHMRIGAAQTVRLAKLFPVPPEYKKDPPAFVRPGQMPENAGREFCYSVNELLSYLEKKPA